jgi:single-stranded DNA-binding protein
MSNPSNSVNAIGIVTKDAKVFPNKDGSRKIKFTVAVKDSYKGKDGKRGAQFVPFEAFVPASKQTNGVFDYIKKGQMVAVSAEVRNNNYTDANGEMKYGIVLVVTSVDLLGSPKKTSEQTEPQAEQTDAPAPADVTDEMPEFEEVLDLGDTPF